MTRAVIATVLLAFLFLPQVPSPASATDDAQPDRSAVSGVVTATVSVRPVVRLLIDDVREVHDRNGRRTLIVTGTVKASTWWRLVAFEAPEPSQADTVVYLAVFPLNSPQLPFEVELTRGRPTPGRTFTYQYSLDRATSRLTGPKLALSAPQH